MRPGTLEFRAYFVSAADPYPDLPQFYAHLVWFQGRDLPSNPPSWGC